VSRKEVKTTHLERVKFGITIKGQLVLDPIPRAPGFRVESHKEDRV
jgi:hypothetical protein